MKSPLLCLLATLPWLSSSLANPVITEIVAVNTGEIEDKDGDLSAWVEFYNPAPDPFDLEGHFVTDDPDALTKYRLPRLRIAPESYGILFLSGKDFHSLFQLEVHAGFTFSDQDDYFALVAPDENTIIDALEDIGQRRGMSFGRLSPDSEDVALFETPTPGEANRNPTLGVVADTKFSVDRGFYTEPIQVEITSKTEGARIIYTTNGRPPGEGSIFTGPIDHVYEGPITISETTVLRAAAFKEGYAPSNIDTQTYIFAEDVVKQPDMLTSITESETYGPQMIDALTSIPTISLAVEDLDSVAKGSSSGNDVEYLTSVELILPDGTKGFQVDAGVSRFGGYFTDFPKKSFRLYFRKRYGPGKLEYPLYRGHESGYPPAEEFDALNLRSGSHDMNARGAYLSNRFIDDTLLEMGHIAPHGRFVHVYFNGLYWGQYHLRERWNAAMFASYFGGEKEDYDAINGNNTGSEFLPGEPYDGNRDYWSEALDLAQEPKPFAALQNHIDMGSYLSFMLTWMSGESESEFQSAGSQSLGVPFKFYFKDADGYLRPPGNRLNNRGPGDMFQEFRAAGEPDFRMLLADTIHKHYFNNGAFTPEKNIARLQRRINETKLSFLAEAARWNFRTPPSWQSFQDNLIERHFPDLTKSMIRLFENADWIPGITAPIFSQFGGQIEPGFILRMNAGTLFSPQPGDLLFTIDGTDPREPGGKRSDQAQVYERKGPGLSLETTTTIKARTLDPNGDWSALTEATFHLGKMPEPGDLVISEIHYHPAAPTTAEIEAGFISQNDFEFIELYNRSSTTLSLIDVALVDGIRFDFSKAAISHLEPGKFIVIAGNSDAFRQRYGTEIPVLGPFEDTQLSNGGETIRLARGSGSTLQSLVYHDTAPWPEEADGSGKSLTLKEPDNIPAVEEPAQWQASRIDGGTPGRLDGGDTTAPGDLEDNDNDGLPAFAEAALGSSDEDPASGADHSALSRDGETVILTLRKHPDASPNRFHIEVSENLQAWTGGGFVLDEMNATPEILRWTSDATSNARFVRVKITAP